MLPYHNTTIKHWNPGAEKPLILPVHLLCNTADEQIYANIRANSHDRTGWVKLEDAHDGIAVLCGSGPSLKDTLPEIREWLEKGATIFGMNGAASFLYENDILADYQVIIDAREQTADLIGPACEHLFASQVHPECFKRKPDAKLWHLQVGNIEDYFPRYEDSYCLIGGAASVGNTATCLAYALGYREIHCYGYDSCHRDGESHAFRQPMNDGDPCAWVDFAGKKYLCSLTMKLQAEKFQDTALALKRAGAKVCVHGTGLLPDMYNVPESVSEEEKYERMWLHSDYREIAPGEHCVETFVALTKPGKVIDLGCGTGRAALRLHAAGYEVLLLDFAGNCRDPEALMLPFAKHDLTKPLTDRAEYGFCTDVMEHIPPEQVDVVLDNIFEACENVFFQIALYEDIGGDLIGKRLHLSLHPHAWWAQKLVWYGDIAWEHLGKDTSLFYVKRKAK